MGLVMYLLGKVFSKNSLNMIEVCVGVYIFLGGFDDFFEIDKVQFNLLYGCIGYLSKYICVNFNLKCYIQIVSL